MSKELKELIEDLTKALEFSEQNGVLKSFIAHFEEQCNEDEIKQMHQLVFELERKEYENYSDFMDDYQPILDLVDFPIKDCIRHFDRLKFPDKKLDDYIQQNKNKK